MLHRICNASFQCALRATAVLRQASNRTAINAICVLCHEVLRMSKETRAQALFLLGMSWCYLVAFGSFWVQYPGLLSDQGLMPASVHLQRVAGGAHGDGNGKPPTLRALHAFLQYPVLSWFAGPFTPEEWTVDDLHDAVALMGFALSVISILTGVKHGLIYTWLWVCYLTLFHIGQAFWGFQWDILLLETGALAALYAPWLSFRRVSQKTPVCWVLRWLLFKLMFMSGVVKVQAKCPSWLKLTALEYHYATQCLPTPFSKWALQLNPLLHRASVAATLLIEGPVALLLVSPLQAHRRLAAVLQIALMVLIALTGNYNWFNLLTCVLCLPVWASVFETRASGSSSPRLIRAKGTAERCRAVAGTHSITTRGTVVAVLRNLDEEGPFVWAAGRWAALQEQPYLRIFGWLSGLAFIYIAAKKMFTVTIGDPALPHMEHIQVDLTMSIGELNAWVDKLLPRVIVAVASFIVFSSLVYIGTRGRSRGAGAAAGACLISALAVLSFAVSIVPTISISPKLREQVPEVCLSLGQVTDRWHLSSGYGLFRKLTGMGVATSSGCEGWGHRMTPSVVARPELVIEGLDAQTGAWREIEFKYKPGCIDCPPRFVAPYQPRLDWQMWFAALSTYQQHPWLVHLVHKILVGSPAVLKLLDTDKYPFTSSNPVAVRILRYHYDFARTSVPWNERLRNCTSDFVEGKWWQRSTKPDAYLPAIQADNPSVKQFLEHHGWSTSEVKHHDDRHTCSSSRGLRWLRAQEFRGDVLQYQYPFYVALLVCMLTRWRLTRE